MGHRCSWALALLLISSCVASTQSDGLFDGQSHWLRRCETSAACGGGLECICGTCTATCGAPGDCEGLPGGLCAEASLLPHEASCTPADHAQFVCVADPGREAPEAAPAAGLTQHAVTLVSWFDGDPVEGNSYSARLLEGSPSPSLSDGDVQLESDPDTGEIMFETPPRGPDVAFHIVGGSYTVGEGRDAIVFETYDSIVLNFSWERGDRRLHVPLVHIAEYEQVIADVELEEGRASLIGHVYWGPGEEIHGGVGCALVYLDDDATGVHVEAAQRYLDGDRLPLGLDDQTATRRNGGFYFGNLTPGRHRFRVTLDGGDTFLAKEDVEITMVREDAWGPSPLLLYQFDIHVDATEDPTPPSCVTPG